MRAGRLRFRVQLQDFTVTRTVLNQPKKDPTPVVLGTYWADISSLSGRELTNAQTIKANVSHKITMRWIDREIKPTYKIGFQGRVFQVLWTDNSDQRRRTLYIYCNEEVAG